jgi:UEV domain
VQNGKFNIPVEVILPPDFPVGAPEVYVRPTPSMVLSESHPFVSATSGEVNTPAIVGWTFPRSNLSSCLTEMSAQFGQLAPVYSRATSSAAGSTSATSSHPIANSQATPSNPYMANPYTPNPLRASASAGAASQRPADTSMYPAYPLARPPTASPPTYPPTNPYLDTPGGVSSQPMFPYGGSGAAGVGGPDADARPRPPAPPVGPPVPTKQQALDAFRETAIDALASRILASIEQSEHRIHDGTQALLAKHERVEANRKVRCARTSHACVPCMCRLRAPNAGDCRRVRGEEG